MGACVYNSIMAQLVRHDYIDWYNKVVETPLKNRNPQYYHSCCHTYSTRKKEKGLQTHPESLSFRKLFKTPADGDDKYNQVKAFYDKYCETHGSFPEQDLPHTLRGCDLTSESEEEMMMMPAKSKMKIGEKKTALSQDSSNAKDLKVANPERLRFKEGILYTTVTVQNQISELRTETSRTSSLTKLLVAENKELAAENKRLSMEVFRMKEDLAEQRQLLSAVNARINDMFKRGLGSMLGKRDQLEPSFEKDTASSAQKEKTKEPQRETSPSSSEIREKDVEDKS